MKLDKHGWELREMVIIMLILLVFLVIVVINIYKLYTQFDIDSESKYLSLQNRIEQAATKYIMNYDIDTSETTVLTSTELEDNHYLTEFNDEDGNHCEGYVIFSYDDCETYLSCPKYTTKNYDNSYLK